MRESNAQKRKSLQTFQKLVAEKRAKFLQDDMEDEPLEGLAARCQPPLPGFAETTMKEQDVTVSETSDSDSSSDERITILAALDSILSALKSTTESKSQCQVTVSPEWQCILSMLDKLPPEQRRRADKKMLELAHDLVKEYQP